MKLKINNVRGFAGTIDVQVDKNNVPLSFFWRKRLKDSRLDKCVEVVKEKIKIDKPKKRNKLEGNKE